MIRHWLTIPAVLVAAAWPHVARAQAFKVDRFSIGGEGGTDYLVAEPGTGRVFISRGTHVMVVDGPTGKVLGDIPDTPRTHGIALAPRWNHGFTTNAGDSTVTMFDLKTLAVIRKIQTHTGGLDGIMYDDFSDRIILTNHSRPIGTATAIKASTGEIVGVAELEDDAPEGAASDGKGRIFVNNERKNTIQVIDVRTMKVLSSWPLAPCDGPTGIAFDRPSNRIFSGCGRTSVVIDATSGTVVATITNGDGVDALGWDASEKLIYIPNGRDGTVTVVHQDSPDKYTVVATVPTMRGAKTIAVDPVKHTAYLFQPEYGPAPEAVPGAPPPPAGSRPPRGPVIAAWFFAIHKEGGVTGHARGAFDVKVNPQPMVENAEGSMLGRLSIDKQFHGDLEATSRGEMLSAGTSVKGSAGYVAIERVSGSLGGRAGTFVLQHSGTMTRGTPQLQITVVPDSGTGELAGLAGTMTIDITNGTHSYAFDYTLADHP